MATLQKKNKKKCHRTKKFYAYAPCTHLPLPSNTQANPKAKSKECNRHRFEKGNRIKIEIFVKIPL
jgi:hypothetical protein